MGVSAGRGKNGVKYQSVRQDIVERIRKGVYAVGAQIPTEDELIESYSVSKGTVRRAVSDLVYEGMLRREQGRGTFVVDSRQSRPTARRNIGVVFLNIHDIHHPYLAAILGGVSQACNERSHNLQLLAAPRETLHHEENGFLVDTIDERHIDGLVLASDMPLDDIMLLKNEGIPFVSIGNIIPDAEVHFVTGDPFQSVCQAMEHLFQAGRRKIAMISSPHANSEVMSLSAFRYVHKEHGLDVNMDHIRHGKLGRELGKSVTRELLALPDRPTAVMAEDDGTAWGVIEAVWEAGLEVPADVAVVGGGNWSSHFSLPLTTIDLRLGDCSRAAIEMLTRMMDGEKIEEPHVVLETRLIVRDSTVVKKAEPSEAVDLAVSA